LERGDLLLFKQADYYAVHRLLAWTATPEGKPYLRTRGDGHPFFDPPVEHERVEGRAIAIEADGYWWNLSGAGARLYALGAVVHDLCWALAATGAKKVDTGLRGLGIGSSIQAMVGRIDRALLGIAHKMLFKRLHKRSQSPPGGSEGAD
jgi:hypothetical protein